jgi:uncharacterized protein (TIGR03118 family)
MMNGAQGLTVCENGRLVMSSFLKSHRQWAMGAVLLCAAVPASAQTGYNQVNLVSDIPGLAGVTDPNLVNPWGLVSSGTSPWWVADNGTSLSTLYNGSGTKQGLVVSISGDDPTGIVFNNTTGFTLPTGGKSLFIFASETGNITAWNGAQGTTAVNVASLAGAAFKGLAIGTTSSSASFLYATDFTQGKVQVYNSSFAPTTVSGGFTDPNLPSGYAPFGVQNIGGKIYVTYAQQSGVPGDIDEVDGAGKGVVDVYDANGNFLQRVASGGTLNAPWGLALAPSNFGQFSNDLLVGNFGDGTINAFDPGNNYAFEGQLLDLQGDPISIDGLWALDFGNGGSAGLTDSLYFTAGLNGESDGLFGLLHVPEPLTLSLFGAGLAGMIAMRRRKQKITKE